MANWATLKAAINNVIKTNGNQAITGQILQNTLNSIVNAIGENATFVGIATPTTNPGASDGPVFYFANEPGVYANFGGFTLNNLGLAILYNNAPDVWQSLIVYECLQNTGDSEQYPMSQKAITQNIIKYTQDIIKYTQALVNSLSTGDYSTFGITNGYIDTGGSFKGSSTNDCTDYIGVAEGDEFNYQGIPGAGVIAVAGYNKDKNYVKAYIREGISLINVNLVIEEGTAYIRACSRNEESTTPTTMVLTKSEKLTKMEDELADVSGKLAKIEDSLLTEDYSTFGITNGYIDTGGSFNSSSTNDCTDYIEVAEGDEFNYQGIPGTRVIAVAGYNKDKNYVKAYVREGTSLINVNLVIEEGTAYIRACSRNAKSTTPTTMVLEKKDYLYVRNRLDEIDNYIFGTKLVDLTVEVDPSEYNARIEIGQSYGTVGAVVQTDNKEIWRHLRISKEENICAVQIQWPSYSNASSIIQYVDDSDVIIKLDAVTSQIDTQKPSIFTIDFPSGATGVYVSSIPSALKLYRYEEATGGLPLETNSKNIVGAINELHGHITSGVGQKTLRLRVLSWNIGHFAKGNTTSSTITEETYEVTKNEFRKVFNHFGADVVGLCEFSSKFYQNETTKEAILGQYKYSYIAPTEAEYIGTALFSAIELDNLEEFTPYQNRAYEGTIKLGDKSVKICMCHLPWSSYETNMMAINAVVSRYVNDKYVIVMGDFNISAGYEEETIKVLTDAGYEVANWGYLGKILTSYNNATASNYLDNVIVKGGSILHTEVLQNTPEGLDPNNPQLSDETKWDAVNLSDHFPIICDIEFSL